MYSLNKFTAAYPNYILVKFNFPWSVQCAVTVPACMFKSTVLAAVFMLFHSALVL